MANAESVYSAKRAASLVNPIAATVFLTADNSAKAAAVYVPDQWQMNSTAGALAFNAHAWGRVTGGTTTNFTPKIQFGTSITAGSNTDTFSGGAVAFNSASGIWRLDAFFVWDFTSKVISGYATGVQGSAGSLVTLAATTQLTAKDLSLNGNGFVVSAIFSATNAGNLAFLDGLTLELA